MFRTSVKALSNLGLGAHARAPDERGRPTRVPRRFLLSLLTLLTFLIGSATSVRAAPLAITVRIVDSTGTYLTGPTATTSGHTTLVQNTDTAFDTTVTSKPVESAGQSQLNTTTTDVTNVGAGLATVRILVTVTRYLLPGGTPLALSSSASGTSSNGLIGQIALLQSYADAANTNGAFLGAPVGTSPGTHVGILPGNAPPTQAYTFGATSNLQALFPRIVGSFYSVTQEFDITLGAGKEASFTLSTAITALPLPATASMGMVLLIGIGGAVAVRKMRTDLG